MDQEEILYCLTQAPFGWLMARADKIRQRHKGDRVHVRALVEFSSFCRRNCLYCGLRNANREAVRYRLEKEEILEAARSAASLGADTVVLQSGEGAVEAAWLAELVAALAENPGLCITLSTGECAFEDYALWRKAGARRFLLRHETSDPALYARLHPGHSLDERLACLRQLKELGYECGGGFMLGLPGQSLESIARDLLLCQSLKLDMAGIGPFLAQASTPLFAERSGGLELTLRAIAVLRLLLPEANIPATTALATLDPEQGQILGLKAGANVLMPSFTPEGSARHYNIYDRKKRVSVLTAALDIEAAGRTHSLSVD